MGIFASRISHPRPRPRRCEAPRRRLRPAVAALEGRALLALITVDTLADGVGVPGTTLREAIGEANASGEADTIAFADGLFASGPATIDLTDGLLFITSDLTIDGPGAGLLTIDADHRSAVFAAFQTSGNAADPALQLSISGLTVANGQADPGIVAGGLFAAFTDLRLDGVDFVDNRADGEGGALYIVSPYLGSDPATGAPLLGRSTLSVDGGTFSGNVSGQGGGAILVSDTDTTIVGASFEGNSAVFGGGISSSTFLNPSAGLVVESSDFTGNSGGNGGAISASGAVDSGTFPPSLVGGSLRVEGSTFGGNSAGSGGAIAALNLPATVRDSRFLDNTAEGQFSGFGGAITYNLSSGLNASLTVEDSRFAGNRTLGGDAFALGGAIFNNGTVIVRGSTFEGNLASASSIAQGGAIHNAFFARLTVESSRFAGNTARATSDFAQAANGGALAGDAGSGMTVLDTAFVGNRAEGAGSTAEGGAIRNEGSGSTPGSDLTIRGSLFAGNTAVGLPKAAPIPGQQGTTAIGGAVANVGGPLLVADSTFLGNRAVAGTAGPAGAGGTGTGGGLSNRGQVMNLSGSTFVGNQALGGAGSSLGWALGGALADEFRSSGPPSTVADSAFLGNAAIAGAGTGGFASGGAIQFGSTPGVLTRIQVIGNLAQGASGATGGNAQGGGVTLLGASFRVVDAQIAGNRAVGGSSPAGGPAGNALGGGLYSSTFGEGLTLSGSHLAGNRAEGGVGATGGDALGGGLHVIGVASVIDSKFTGNRAITGLSGVGYGGAIYVAPNATFTIDKKSKLAGNKASTAGDGLYQA